MYTPFALFPPWLIRVVSQFGSVIDEPARALRPGLDEHRPFLIVALLGKDNYRGGLTAMTEKKFRVYSSNAQGALSIKLPMCQEIGDTNCLRKISPGPDNARALHVESEVSEDGHL